MAALEQRGHEKTRPFPSMTDMGGSRPSGAGTFSRTTGGNFSAVETSIKYETIYANQFAMYQQVEGSPSSVAQVLTTDHPTGGCVIGLSRGSGTIIRSIRSPGTTTVGVSFPRMSSWSSFRQILPNNYRETQLSSRGSRWHAEEYPQGTNNFASSFCIQQIWLAGPRGFSANFSEHVNEGNREPFHERAAGRRNIKGIVLDRQGGGGGGGWRLRRVGWPDGDCGSGVSGSRSELPSHIIHRHGWG